MLHSAVQNMCHVWGALPGKTLKANDCGMPAVSPLRSALKTSRLTCCRERLQMHLLEGSWPLSCRAFTVLACMLSYSLQLSSHAGGGP